MLKFLAKYPTDFYEISPAKERSLIISSHVNEVIKTILSQCIFLQKDIARTTTLTSKN